MCVQAFLIPQLKQKQKYSLHLETVLNIQKRKYSLHSQFSFEGGPHLASGFNSLAESSAAGLAVEDVCDEQVLCGMHDESALFHVAPNTEE